MNRYTFLIVASSVVVFAAYIASYYAVVEPVPSGIFRTGPGPWPKTAVYPLGHDVMGSGRFYRFDDVTHPLYSPINNLDRKLRPTVWLEE